MTEYIGPKLPKIYKPDCNEDEDDPALYGPALPPDLMTQSTPIIGPSLPPSGGATDADADDNEDIIVGPLPPPSLTCDHELMEKISRRKDIESRSASMKEKLNPDSKSSSQQVREEWMMELPPEINQAIGVSMTSRKFRTKNIEIGDRSVWTDTPAEKARKEKEGHTRRSTATEEQQGVLLSGRDKELKEIVEKHNKDHRNVSLYELHRKRKTENADDGVNERKPFNRETDLQLPQNVITNAKRQTLIKDSSKSLNNKFTHGKKHFL